MDRRDFLKQSTLASIGLAYGTSTSLASEKKGELRKRRYGSQGPELSIIGFGGIVIRGAEQSHANKVVAKAVERGVNYFDVAPTYGDAEERLGPALEPFREEAFLACKTHQREKDGAEKELHESLKKLRTDHFDLYQLHALSSMEDVDQVFAKDGAMQVFLKAKEEGLVKNLGFSAHSAEAAIAAMERYDFDSILFPFNYVTWHEGDFGPQVIEKAKEKGAARLALKAMAKTRWPEDADRSEYKKCWYQPVSERENAEMALRFTLSLDVTAAIPPGEEELFFLALDIAEQYSPLSEQEQTEVKQMAQGVTPIFSRNA